MVCVNCCSPGTWGPTVVLGGGYLGPYRDTSLIRNCLPPGPYNRPMRRALSWSQGKGGRFLMSVVPLYSGLRGEGRTPFRRVQLVSGVCAARVIISTISDAG